MNPDALRKLPLVILSSSPDAPSAMPDPSSQNVVYLQQQMHYPDAAVNADGKMVAFIVFVPFLVKNDYMADVTRHGKDAPGGVMKTIIYDAFQIFKEEGVGYGSLGVAPLAGLDSDSKNPSVYDD